MSALLTTTMTYMKTVIDGFEAAGRGHIKMAVGGAPISQMFADEIGADGYGQNASAAVDLFLRLAGEAVPARPSPAAGGTRRPMPTEGTTYKILYWQEIPSQIKAEDDAGNDVSAASCREASPERIDALGAERGFSERRRLPRAVEVERRTGARRLGRKTWPKRSKRRTGGRRPTSSS